MNVGLGHPQLVGEQRARGDGGLGGVPHRQTAAAFIILGNDATRLYRLGAASLRSQLLPQDDVGFRKAALDIAERVHGPAGDVAVGVVMNDRRAFHGRRHKIDCRHRRFVGDLDQLECVFGDVTAFGDNERDRLADEAHLAGRERAVRARIDEAAIVVEQRHGIVGRPEVLMRDDGEHARQGQRCRLVDRPDPGLGMRAAKHRPVRHVREMNVVDEGGASGQQRGVLKTLDALADESGAHAGCAFASADSSVAACAIAWTIC